MIPAGTVFGPLPEDANGHESHVDKDRPHAGKVVNLMAALLDGSGQSVRREDAARKTPSARGLIGFSDRNRARSATIRINEAALF